MSKQVQFYMGWARTTWLRGCHFSKDLKMSAHAYRYLRAEQGWHWRSPQDRVTPSRNSTEASVAEAQGEGGRLMRNEVEKTKTASSILQQPSSPNLQHEDQVLEIFKIIMMSVLTAK